MIYIFYRISVKYPEKTFVSQNGDHRRTNGDARAVAKLRHRGAIVDRDVLFACERFDRRKHGWVCIAGDIQLFRAVFPQCTHRLLDARYLAASGQIRRHGRSLLTV